MPKYTLLADGFSHATLDKKGDITGKVRHKKGDEVEMKESEAQRLVDAGAFVLSSEVGKDPEPVVTVETTGASDGSPLATAGPDGALVLTDEGAAAQPEDPTEDADADDDADDAVDYSDETVYDYSDLQALAKSRDLSAGGSRADLVERLTEYDKAQSA